MVGIVIVAHSGGFAGSVKELVEHLVQGKAAIAVAGSVEDGSFGTSVPAVQEAIDYVYSDDGVEVLMDMGSIDLKIITGPFTVWIAKMHSLGMHNRDIRVKASR